MTVYLNRPYVGGAMTTPALSAPESACAKMALAAWSLGG
jgi:hypothetical protein